LKILVTGGLGFIGSNFILYTIEKFSKYKITNIDAQLIGSNTQNLKSLKNNQNYRYVKGNITNRQLIERLVSQHDVVFNFAAQSHVDRSIADPQPFMHSNVMGTFTILNAVQKFKKKLIQISTDEVFGSLKTSSATEESPLRPSSSYAASKASADLLVQSYHITYGTDAIITRCTNNYGPRQFPEKLIPKTIILALNNKKIPIYGKGKNIRDWLFVVDHCKSILKIFEKGKSGESYNISGHNEFDNNTIVRKILKMMGKSTDLIKHIKDRQGHDFRYSLDSSKIEKKLHWKPSHNFEESLIYTIDWYRNNKKWWKGITLKNFGRI